MARTLGSTRRKRLRAKKDAGLISSTGVAPDQPLTGPGSQEDLANQQLIGLGREALDFQRDIAGRQFGLSERALGLSEKQVAIAQQQEARASELYNFYLTNYRPGETQWIRESFAGISPSQAVARAVGGVEQQATAVREITDRNLTRLGIDPSSGRALSARSSQDLQIAAAKAGAANRARLETRDINRQRRTQAVAAGLGLPIQSAQQSGQAAGILGQAGQGISQASTGLARAAQGVQSGFTGLGNIFQNIGNQEFQAGQAGLARSFTAGQNQLDRDAQARAARAQGIGDIIGTIGGVGLGLAFA